MELYGIARLGDLNGKYTESSAHFSSKSKQKHCSLLLLHKPSNNYLSISATSACATLTTSEKMVFFDTNDKSEDQSHDFDAILANIIDYSNLEETMLIP